MRGLTSLVTRIHRQALLWGEAPETFLGVSLNGSHCVVLNLPHQPPKGQGYIPQPTLHSCLIMCCLDSFLISEMLNNGGSIGVVFRINTLLVSEDEGKGIWSVF